MVRPVLGQFGTLVVVSLSWAYNTGIVKNQSHYENIDGKIQTRGPWPYSARLCNTE